MALDLRLERDIAGAEGTRTLAYQDEEGYWTIGKGHLLPLGHDWTGYTISTATAQVYFEADITEAMHFAARLPEWAACDTDCRQNALIELCFNLGSRWLGFTFSRHWWLLKDWQETSACMLDSKWAKQVKGRATRLANYVLAGKYP